MLAKSCWNNHPLEAGHKCKLILATGVRLPGYSLPKALDRELNPPLMKVYKKWKKKEEELSTTLKRYRETNHIKVLNLKNPTSWEDTKSPSTGWKTSELKGTRWVTSTTCISSDPKGKQLDHFVEETVCFLRDPNEEPLCYRRMMQPGYALQKVYLGTEFPKEKQERKRKASEDRAKGASSNPITLEETEDPKDEQQSNACKPISTLARSEKPPEQKRSRLEEIIRSARNRAETTESRANPRLKATPKRLNKPPVDAGFPDRHF